MEIKIKQAKILKRIRKSKRTEDPPAEGLIEGIGRKQLILIFPRVKRTSDGGMIASIYH